MTFFNQRNGFLRKLIHVSEEAAPPSHVPVMLSGEWVVATYQDFRRREYIRQFSYCKIGPNGALIPMQVSVQESNFVEHFIPKAFQMFGQSHIGMQNSQLADFLTNFNQSKPQEELVRSPPGFGKRENPQAQGNNSLDAPPTASFNHPKAEPKFINRGTMTSTDVDMEHIEQEKSAEALKNREDKDKDKQIAEDIKNGKDGKMEDETIDESEENRYDSEDSDTGKRLTAME